jgi:hypothetical protein
MADDMTKNNTILSSLQSPTMQFQWVMRIFIFIYFVGAMFFFFMPNELFYLINIGPRVLKIYEEIAVPSERFWLVLATSMMVMLLVTSAYSSRYPKIKGYAMIHLASKATSVAGFLYCFLTVQPAFAYLLGAVTDSLVFVVVLAFFVRNLNDKNHASR